jgi:hypothetical protein
MQHSPEDTREHTDRFEGTDDLDEDFGGGVVDDEEGEGDEEAGEEEGGGTHVEWRVAGGSGFWVVNWGDGSEGLGRGKAGGSGSDYVLFLCRAELEK